MKPQTVREGAETLPETPPIVLAEAEEKKPELVSIRLDLPPAAGGGISHAGVFYLPRVEYKVPVEVARDLVEIEARTKSHESSLHESENKSRRRMNAYVR